MSNKNPFELRFEVLAMAKTMLDQQYDFAISNFWAQLEDAKEKSKDISEVYEKYLPKMYEPTEVMNQAEELYKFINNKS